MFLFLHLPFCSASICQVSWLQNEMIVLAGMYFEYSLTYVKQWHFDDCQSLPLQLKCFYTALECFLSVGECGNW